MADPVYYKVNNAYGVSPDGVLLVTVGKKERNLQPMPARLGYPTLSTFARRRAQRLLLRDKTALNWVIGAKADTSYWSGAATKPYLGTDPEFFLVAGGKLIPAFDVLQDKKASPTLFWDGFQAEFTWPGQLCIQLLADGIQGQMIALLKAARAKQPKATLLPQDSIQIEPRKYKPEHLQLGCDPSLNAYGVQGDIPLDPSQLPWRFAGGHLHFGLARLKNHPDKVREAVKIVKALDKTVGVFSVGAGALYEQNKVRRRYYGLAGEFRLPPHGLEYRTLSNYWLCHPAIMQLTFEFARAIFQLAPLGLLDFWYGDEDTVQAIINTYDVREARKLLKRNEKLFMEIFQAANETFQIAGLERDIARKAFQVGMEGIEYAVADPTDIEENWRLKAREAAGSSYINNTNLRAGWFGAWQNHAKTLR